METRSGRSDAAGDAHKDGENPMCTQHVTPMRNDSASAEVGIEHRNLEGTELTPQLH